MSFSSNATFPLTRRTPRKFQLKRKRRTVCERPPVEKLGDNYGGEFSIEQSSMEDSEWYDDSYGYENQRNYASQGTSSFQPQPHASVYATPTHDETRGFTYSQSTGRPAAMYQSDLSDKQNRGMRTRQGRSDKDIYKGNFYDSEGSLFSTAMTHYMLELMLNEVQLGRPNGGVLHSSAWPEMVSALNAKFKTTVTVKQAVLKANRMKKEYREFMKLKQWETGMGWNHQLDIPVMSDDWWDNVAKGNKELCKFSYETLPKFETLNKIFDGQVATGKYSQSSMGESLRRNSMDTDSLGQDPTNENTIDLNGTPEVQPEPYSARLPKPTRPNKKQRSGGREDAIVTTLKVWGDCRMASVQGQGQGTSDFDPAPPNSDLAACMSVLQRMNGIDGNAFLRACELFKEPYNRHLFALLENDQRRAWVNSHQNIPGTHTPASGHVPFPTQPNTPIWDTQHTSNAPAVVHSIHRGSNYNSCPPTYMPVDDEIRHTSVGRNNNTGYDERTGSDRYEGVVRQSSSREPNWGEGADFLFQGVVAATNEGRRY